MSESEYVYSFDDLRGDILGVIQSMGDAHRAQQKLDEAVAADIQRLWADNAALRDELHALANRVESLTRARLTEPAEVAARMYRLLDGGKGETPADFDLNAPRTYDLRDGKFEATDG